MKVWPVQDAKAKFSELLESCVTEGPQMVTKRGAATAVLVPVAEWERLTQTARPNLKDLLMMDEHRFDLDVDARVKLRRRPPIDL